MDCLRAGQAKTPGKLTGACERDAFLTARAALGIIINNFEIAFVFSA
jgi:hypothetical protein